MVDHPMISNWIQLPEPNVLRCFAVPLFILSLVSLWVVGCQYFKPKKDIHELKLRVQTFWWIVGLLGLSLILTPNLAIIFWAGISYLALREYFSIIPTRQIDHRVLLWAYLSIPIQYYWIASNSYAMMAIFIPVYVFLFLPLRMVLLGETKGFLRAVGTIHWGVMMMVYCLSCVAALYLLDPNFSSNVSSAPGLIFYLLFLNQFNDALQFFFGKCFGKHPIAPRVSPKKTIEGFLGGLLTIPVIAVLLAPVLTPLSMQDAGIIGVMIACAGFIGDIIMSALKRDLNLKDTSTLLPGHGGILDRIDSLIFTAPLYFHYIRYFYG